MSLDIYSIDGEEGANAKFKVSGYEMIDEIDVSDY
jgi:hypothetical protein